jgi:hypothetical protein
MDCTCCSDGHIRKVVGIPASKSNALDTSKSKKVAKVKIVDKHKAGHIALHKSANDIKLSAKGTYTITFGDVAENGVRMEKIGVESQHGISVEDLKRANATFIQMGINTELVDITTALTEDELAYLKTPEGKPASVKNSKLPNSMKDKSVEAVILIIRNGADALLGAGAADILKLEQQGIHYDTKKIWYGKVCNSHARHNVCFSTYDQVMDLDNKKGTIIDFKHLPMLEKLHRMLPTYFSTLDEEKIELKAEGNYYFNLTKCGIGWHGDKERKIVIALRLGETMSLHYHWYYGHQQVGSRVDLMLNHGDIYIMSEKAVGTDTGSSTKLTLRHGAGAFKE